jgi:hypothetical protein
LEEDEVEEEVGGRGGDGGLKIAHNGQKGDVHCSCGRSRALAPLVLFPSRLQQLCCHHSRMRQLLIQY